MTEGLEILEIVSQPWQWVPELDGVPTRGAGRFVQPADHALQARDGVWDAGVRRFSFAFVSRTPDVLFDRTAVPVAQLAAVMEEVEAAVLRMICGQSGGEDALRRAGEALSRLVLPACVFERLFGMSEGTPLVIRPDELAAAIPFELCHDSDRRCFLGQHLAVSRGVACRRVPFSAARQRAATADCSRLAEGVVVVNPERDPSLKRLAAGVSSDIDALPPGASQALSLYAGSALSEALSLLGAPWLLYAGHIRHDEVAGSYIAFADGHRLTASDIGDRLAVGSQPQCVVLNGCGGDCAAPDWRLPGRAATRASFARAFYEAGVGTVIGSRWDIDLGTACALNGHVLRAMAAPRETSIGETLRQFRLGRAPGWACYTLYGDPRRMFRFEASAAAPRQLAGARHHPLPPSGPSPCQPVHSAQTGPAAVLPTLRNPLCFALLLDTTPYGAKSSKAAVRLRFVESLSAELAVLNARLAPHGRGSVCLIRVAGWPHPFVRTVPLTVQELKDCVNALDGTPSPTSGGRLGAASALAALVTSLRHDPWTVASPAPVIVLLLGSEALGGGTPTDLSRDLSELVLLCDDLRAGAASDRPGGRRDRDTGDLRPPCPHVWAVGLDDAVPPDLLLTLTGGVAGRTARLAAPDEASAVAARVFGDLRAAFMLRARGQPGTVAPSAAGGKGT